MRLYRRGKTYWFELVFEGQRYQRTTKERNRVKAEGIASAFRMALAERRVGIVERKAGAAFTTPSEPFWLGRRTNTRSTRGRSSGTGHQAKLFWST